MDDYRVLIFDLESNGHHARYIQHLLEYCIEKCRNLSLLLVVSPEFLVKHQKILGQGNFDKANNIQTMSITQMEFLKIKKGRSPTLKAVSTWPILKRYAQKLKIDHCIVMWFDHILQFSLALHREFPCSISGICFRPRFHYTKWESHRLSFADRLKGWRQLILYFMAVRHPQLRNLFCLDPFAPAAINNLSRHNKALSLPDPVERRLTPIHSLDLTDLKKSLKIESQRKIFLFFGAIAARKGIYKVIEAFKQLSPKICQEITLLIVGEIVHSQESQKIINLIAGLRDTSPIQIIFQNEYVSDTEMIKYFSLADIILAPYQKHVGMSGILLQAAVAGKPVISSNYGLMGRMMQRYELGIATDTTQPQAIATAIKNTMNYPVSKLCNQEKMMDWVLANSPEKFSATIMDNIIRARV